MAVNEKEIIVKEITYDGSPVLVEAARRDADGNIISSAYAKSGYKNLYKKAKYLYNVDYDVLDYDFAMGYFQAGKDNLIYGDGASVRKSNLFGHNYNTYYSNAADFCVSVSKTQNRYASIGISKGVKGLTKSVIESKQWNEGYLLLPFAMSDGINEHGLFCSVSLVYDETKVPMPTPEGKFLPEWIYTTGTTPIIAKRISLCEAMVVRYVLDNFDNATDAVNYLRDYASIYVSKEQYNNKQELHYIIGDKNNTYSVELKANVLTIINLDTDQKFAGQKFITDFRLAGITDITEDKKVICPGTWTETTGKPSIHGMEKYGRGLERYNYIVSNYSALSTLDTFKTLMKDIRFTRIYKSHAETYADTWYSDYIDFADLSVDSKAEDFTEIVNQKKEEYTARTRKDDQSGTLQTSHTTIYDINAKALYVASQEDYTTYYEFAFVTQDITKQTIITALGYEPENPAKKVSSIRLTGAEQDKYASEKAVADALNNIKPKSGTGIVVDDEGKINVDQTVIQSKIKEEAKLSSDLVDDTNKTNKFVTAEEKTEWSGKQDAITTTNKLSASLVSGLPTDLKDLKNNTEEWDGSAYASRTWVENNAGKVNEIKVNGTKVEPVDKVVNLTDATLGLTTMKSTTVDTGTSIDVDTNGVTKLNKTTVNLGNGAHSVSSSALPEASLSQNGLMSKSDYDTLTKLVSRVEKLEGRTVRLIYTVKDNPTSTEIKNFVEYLYPEKTLWSSISVVVQVTKHVWNYYSNIGAEGSWVDDGVDTVSPFTNETAGIIKGIEADGKIFAETNGIGSVYGWDALQERVGELEGNRVKKEELRRVNGNVLYGEGGDIQIKTSPTIYDETINAGVSHEDTINTKTSGKTLNDGDIFIIREWLNADKLKSQCTTYIYDSNLSATFKWRATDGNYSAEHVYFTKNIQLGGDYTSVGNVKLTEGSIEAKNKSLSEIFDKIFTKRIQPTAVEPKAFAQLNVTSSTGSFHNEAGTSINITGTASLTFSKGSYTYGPDTGVTATGYSLSYTDINGDTMTYSASSKDIAEGFVIGDTSKTIKASGSINHTASTASAKDNLGDLSNPEVKILSGAKDASEVSITFTSYRAVFNAASTNADTLNSAWIRNTSYCTNKGDVTITTTNTYDIVVPEGTKRVLFAIPASKGHDALASVIDVDGMGLESKNKFTHTTLAVNDASGSNPVNYDVFYFDNINGMAATTFKFKFN